MPTDSSAKLDPNLGGFAYNTAEVAPAPEGSPAQVAPNPDNPPWGVLLGIGVTLASLFLLVIVQVVFIIPYVLSFHTTDPAALQTILKGDRVILLSLIAVIPAHLLTLGVAWMVVTGFGKRPFFQTLGWRRSPRLGYLEFLACLGLTLLLLGAAQVLVKIFGDPETELERMILSSTGARYTVAALATFTAPLVEEVVFRGILYSGLRHGIIRLYGAMRYALDNFADVKNAWHMTSILGAISYVLDRKKIWENGIQPEKAGKIGTVSSVIVVIIIFAAIHVPQYLPNVAAISTILLLSSVLTIVRARTGRLLPCVVIHFFFNGITSVLIVLEPFIEHKIPPPPAPPTHGALVSLFAHAAQLFF